MPTTWCSFSTPLGALEFSAEVLGVSSYAPATRLSVNSRELQPRLPDGMRVKESHCVLFRIETEEPSEIELTVRLDCNESVVAGAETGEGLEAQVWRSSRHVLAVGTEDAEFLLSRTGQSDPKSSASYKYKRSSLSIRLTTLGARRPFTFHFVAAWGPCPETTSESCWYAVDQLHSYVIDHLAA